MQKIELGDSLLGYLPNLTEKRKVVDQRQVSTLENVRNYYQWFEEKLAPVQAIFSVKEHVVRLLYTNDYGDYESENDIEPKFHVSQREYSLKTGEALPKPKAEYIINDRLVMKTEYGFAKYLVENFDTLEEVQAYADNENKQIQGVIAAKEERLQLENQKRLEAEQERRKQAQKDYEIALNDLEATTIKNILKESEREKMVEKRTQTELPVLTPHFREDYDKYSEAKFNDSSTLKRTNPERYRANIEANRLAWLLLNIKHSKTDYDALSEGEKKEFYKSIRAGNNYIEKGLRGELFPEKNINVVPMYPEDRKNYLITQAAVEELEMIADDARSYARAHFKDNAFEVFYNVSTGQIVRSATGKGEYLKVASVFSNGSFEKTPLFEHPENYRKEEIDMKKHTQEVVQETTQELPNDPMELSQHALKLVKNWSEDPKAMAEYLEFMSKFPDLSPRNVALIHSQWRGANAVATFDQWNGKTTDIRKNMPKVLGIKSADVEGITRTITDKKTGETKTIVLDGLSVRSGEKSQITLIGVNNSRYFEKENDGKVQRHYEKYWTAEDKRKVSNHEVEVKNYQKFYPYKVFEISQTNIKPERLPEVMPNRHINFEHDEKLVHSMKTGLEVYAQSLEQPVSIEWTKVGEVNPLGNAGGAFYPEANKIVMNHLNTPGENITTLIHELTHASLHKQGSTQKSSEEYAKQELEAEMTAFVVSKHYGIDTQERSIPYIAQWTENAKIFDDKEMSQSLGKIQRTAGKMIKTVDASLDPDLKKVQKIEQAHQRAQKIPINKEREIGR
ncbi:zincin-like metallopeptidase domain-containing protein [Lactococcus muris]|uniref:Zincin-like metallopeptidase domain-containing protein n=1 Tax=Lactococcus muris TaxID=2941330 RepID=A0ABV4DCF3_9LACT